MADETNTAVEETVQTDNAAVEEVTPIVETPLEDLFSMTPSPKPSGDIKPSTEEVKEEEIDESADDKAEVTPSIEKPEDAIKADYEKRLKDTRDYATRVNNENLALQRQMADQAKYLTMINKKLDGEWTEDDEQRMQSPPQPSPQEAAQFGHTEGKIAASRVAAYDIYGKDEVENTLFAENAPFRGIMNDPIVKAKVLGSDAPVIEAMKIVKVKQFYDKWGYEPASIEKNMRETIEKELTDKITQKILKKMQGKENISTGIRDVRSADRNENVVTHTPLKDIFG